MSFLAKIFEFFSVVPHPFLQKIYDFDLEQWDLRRQAGESLEHFLARIATHQEFLRGEDNAGYDLSVHAAHKWNTVVQEHPQTFYFAYNTNQTFKFPFFPFYRPRLNMNPLLLASAVWMGQHTFDSPLYSGFNDADWWPNDGAVSVWSQESTMAAL